MEPPIRRRSSRAGAPPSAAAAAAAQPPPPPDPPRAAATRASKRKTTVANELLRAAGPRGQALPDDLSDGEPHEEYEGEEGEWRAASELSSPNPHSIFNGSNDTDSDSDDGEEEEEDLEEEEEEEEVDWSHLEVGADQLAENHPPYDELVGADVCVMAAAFAPDFELTTPGSVGWRGQVSDTSFSGPLTIHLSVPLTPHR